MKRKINIGFDIGITSVGWALVDEENNIIDRGVRLFEELKNPKDGKLLNQERRAKRTLRRIIRRKQNRKLDFIKLIANKYYNLFELKSDNFESRKQEIELILKNPKFNDVLELKVKAIKQEINKHEVLKILYNYLSHRGFTYLDIEKYDKRVLNIDKISQNEEYRNFANWFLTKDRDADKKEIEDEASKIYNKNDFKSWPSFLSAIKIYCSEKDYIENFPSILQYREYKTNKEYRGSGSINDKFFIYDWKKEIEKVLQNQSYLSHEFKDEFLFNENSLFLRLRDFSDGPGIGSKYGLYEKNGNENYTIKSNQFTNLWDKLLGKCSIYPAEFRADKKSTSQEIANILSQLNTLKINDSNRKDSYLNIDEKKSIIFHSIKQNKTTDLKIISKIINCKTSDIFHYPTDIKKTDEGAKSKFEELNNSRKLFVIFNEENNINDFDEFMAKIDFFNKIINIISKNPDNVDKQKNKLIEELNLKLSFVQEIISANIDAKSTSSMSLKALNSYIDDEINDKGLTINQKFKSIIDKNQEKTFGIDTSKSKYIDESCLNDEIMSPTTKCSFRETLKVFNAILKKYIYNGDFLIKNIVLEMPTEWNSKEQRESETKIQRANEAKREKVKEFYDGENLTIINKLLLLESQNGKDIYSGEALDRAQIVSNPSYCDVDHIIPFSVSFDNSLNNRVLTLNKYNKEKGKRTPFQYLEKGKYCQQKDNLWKQLYLDNEKKDLNNKVKYGYLTLEHLDYNRNLGFIGRNLSDTRYACRVINSYIKTWVKTMNENQVQKEVWADHDVNVININGRFSQRYRRKEFLDIKKDRDSDFSHHAIDATICGILGNTTFTMGKLVWFRDVDHETGEVKSSSKSQYKNISEIEQLEDKFDNEIKWHDIKENVKNSQVKFSYKLTKKTSFKLWGDTIVSIKKKDDKYEQANKTELLNIKDLETTAKYIDTLKKEYAYISNGKNSYPDPKLFDDVLQCYEEGKKLCLSTNELNKKNPFLVYMDEFNKINNIEKTPTKLALSREGHIYYVKSLKTHEKINSFSPIKKDINNSQNKFGGYTGLNWKEIRLYATEKGFRVIPVQANSLDDKLINFKIEKDAKYFTVHKNQTLINKNDITDIQKIVGGNFIHNQLEIKPIYKKNEKQNHVSINKILNNYDFCEIDMLGNYWIKKLDL